MDNSEMNDEFNCDIHNILDNILIAFNMLSPKYCGLFDDPRINTYYISLSNSNYIKLQGICDDCEYITLYRNDNLKHNIMTFDGLNKTINYSDEDINNTSLKILEIKIDIDSNMDNIILLIKQYINMLEMYSN